MRATAAVQRVTEDIMQKNEMQKEFEVVELDEASLDAVAGGGSTGGGIVVCTPDGDFCAECAD